MYFLKLTTTPTSLSQNKLDFGTPVTLATNIRGIFNSVVVKVVLGLFAALV